MVQIYRDFLSITSSKVLDSKLILFGAGGGIQVFKEKYPDLKVSYIVDNDCEKWGTQVLEYEIKNPEILMQEDKSKSLILITSMYYDAIGEQLESYGYKEHINYFNGLPSALKCLTCTINRNNFQQVFKEFQKRNIQYVILRDFENLPLVPDKDIDLLLKDESNINAALQVPGISYNIKDLVCDMYNAESNDKYLPYFPTSLAEQLIQTRVLYKEHFYIPNVETYFYSLIYHVLYRKSHLALEYKEEKYYLSLKSKYIAELESAFKGVNKKMTLDLMDLHNILKEKEFHPSLDLLRKMAMNAENPFLFSLIENYKEVLKKQYPEIINSELMVFIARGFKYDAKEIEKITLSLKKKFELVYPITLTEFERQSVIEKVRGGNWGDDPLYEQSGGPLAYFICLDQSPEKPTQDMKRKNPYLSNLNYFIKHDVRKELGEGKRNLLHSSDDVYEALEYIEVLNVQNQQKILNRINDFLESSV